MPVFDLDFRRPVADGVLSPASGELVFTPTRRRVAQGRVVLPLPFSVRLGDGRAIVDLAVTDERWVWKVVEKFHRLDWCTYYVSVPAAADDLSFWDLPRVDPSSLDPVADPEAAWWGAVDEMIVGAEVDGDGLQLTRQNGDTFSAGRVRGDEGDKGDAGDSAYQLAVANGFEGTESEWLDSLHGADGAVIVDDATAQAARGYRNEAQAARDESQTAATESSISANASLADADRAQAVLEAAEPLMSRAEAAAASTPTITISDTQPADPKSGDIWFDTGV